MRVEYPGAIYHIMSRGDRREDIFHDEVDRQDFLKTLAEACQKADFQVHAYCLMRNHFHLVLAPPQWQPGRRDVLALEELHAAPESPAQTLRPCVQRTLQSPGRRWSEPRIPENGLR